MAGNGAVSNLAGCEELLAEWLGVGGSSSEYDLCMVCLRNAAETDSVAVQELIKKHLPSGVELRNASSASRCFEGGLVNLVFAKDAVVGDALLASGSPPSGQLSFGLANVDVAKRAGGPTYELSELFGSCGGVRKLGLALVLGDLPRELPQAAALHDGDGSVNGNIKVLYPGIGSSQQEGITVVLQASEDSKKQTMAHTWCGQHLPVAISLEVSTNS